MFPWFHDFLIEGVDHSNKALGEWGICIVWRNLNSIFCSVTFQSAYSVKPCVELSFLFCFYSHSSFKKWRTSLVVHFVNPREACLWTLPVMNCLYRGLNWCRIVWSEEQAQFDLFSWIILDSVFPSGSPGLFSLCSICRKTCGQGGPVSSGSFRICLPKVHFFHEVYS